MFTSQKGRFQIFKNQYWGFPKMALKIVKCFFQRSLKSFANQKIKESLGFKQLYVQYQQGRITCHLVTGYI
jgi:hypothetical protein